MTDSRDEARRARDEALGKLAAALDRGPEVSAVAEQARGWRERNHFADLLIAAMEARR